MRVRKSLVLLIAIVGLLLSPVSAIACACCSNPGDYHSGLTDVDEFQLSQLQRVRFARPASLYMTEAGMEEDAFGVDQPKMAYSISSAFNRNVLKLTFRSGTSVGTLELPLPNQMWTHAADIHDMKRSGGGGPSLYKEWRLEGDVKGSGIFENGMTAPAKYELVLQGRGNGCDTPEDFNNWRLEVTGEKTRFAFYGKLARPLPSKQHHGSKPIMVQAAPDAAELTKLLKEFLAGASRNDPAIHDRFWAEDLIYTRSAGRRTSKAEIMSGLKSAPASSKDAPETIYTAEDIRIQQYGNTAIVAFRLVATTTDGGAKQVQNLLNSGTFLKRNGKWQVVNWQSTRMPRTREQDTTDVTAAAADFRQAVLGADTKKLEAVTDATFVWFRASGREVTRPMFIAELGSGELKPIDIQLPREAVWLYGDTAIYTGESNREQSPTARYMMVLTNDGGVWKVVALHTGN
jgi:ketosteroid isomerase-like protein